MKEKDFIGKKLVSMADGVQVGTVKDLIFQGLDLTALVVRGEHGEGLLPYKEIGTNGPDAITIESYKLVDWNAGHSLQPDSRSSHDLRKLNFMDADGKLLGRIHDLTMDEVGHIQTMGVRTEGVFGLGSHETVVPASSIRALGSDMVTVDGKQKG